MKHDNYMQLFLIWVRDRNLFDRYQREVAAVARRYVDIERSLAPQEIYGERLSLPDIANVTIAPSKVSVDAMRADPEFQAVVGMRARSTDLVRVAGPAESGTVHAHDLEHRLYLVEIAAFGTGGEEAYRSYEREADTFMAPYSYHVERVFRPDDADGLPFQPNLVKVAYFDDPTAMERMHEDPGHSRIEHELYGSAVAQSLWLVAKARTAPVERVVT